MAVVAGDVGLGDVLLQDDAILLGSETECPSTAVTARAVVVRIGIAYEQYQRSVAVDGNGCLGDVASLDGHIVLGIARLAIDFVGKPFRIKLRVGEDGIFVCQMVIDTVGILVVVVVVAYVVSLVLVIQYHLINYLVVHPHAILLICKPDVPHSIFLGLPVGTQHRIAVIIFEVTGTAARIVDVQVELWIYVFKDEFLDHQRLCGILALVDIAIGVFNGVERQPFVDGNILARCAAL